jgi:hypothetical protein
VLALGTMLYSIDLTVLHLAVPALRKDLQPSSALDASRSGQVPSTDARP